MCNINILNFNETLTNYVINFNNRPLVSLGFVKISNIKITNMLWFLLKIKNVRIFCSAKDSHIFQQKITIALQKILTFFQQKIMMYLHM